MNKFNEYPKVMKHPAHTPALWKTLEGKGTGLFTPDTICTQTERFPDVTVVTLDDERRYVAKGYRPASNPNPEEYEQAMLDSQPFCGHQFQEFPKYKYHAYEFPVVVKNKEEESDLGDEWKDSPVVFNEEETPEPSKIDKRTREYRQQHLT